MAGAETALQEFIDALQALILLLPRGEPEDRTPGRPAESPEGTGLAVRRTLTTARQLHARLIALRQPSSSGQNQSG